MQPNLNFAARYPTFEAETLMRRASLTITKYGLPFAVVGGVVYGVMKWLGWL